MTYCLAVRLSSGLVLPAIGELPSVTESGLTVPIPDTLGVSLPVPTA